VENVTKERLTGALILVAALVILVPEMLSGPDSDHAAATTSTQDPAAGPPLRTYDMLLEPSSGAQPAAQETLTPASPVAVEAVPPPVTQAAPPAAPEVVAPAPAAAPTLAEITESAKPETATPAKPQVRESAPVQAAVKTPPPAAKEKPEVAKPAASGKWWVQVGVFASRDNAQRLTSELKAAGFPAEVAQIRLQGKELHRVRAGPAADRAAAAALQARLAAKGHKSSLVAP
jgi:DedD protein